MKLLSKMMPAVLFLSVALFSEEEPRRFFFNEMNHQDFLKIFEDKSTSSIIEVQEGTRLPIRLEGTGSVFSIEEPENAFTSIVIKQPFYVKINHSQTTADCSACDGEGSKDPVTELLFSKDLVNWQSFEDCFTGDINMGVFTDESNPYPVAKLSVELEFAK